ncbi:RcsF protein [Colwellia chukchiensis]|uniref:RcsF protein n=1 Tax=Colwellia chukchiensis TaxID=641665 RepID=A0A1H7QCX5_9GAMM|nr:Rcs stress response system protein RcsF [Colwellia chukchiensis]SEL45803.1 RcsF protein [Colwellia chukchiensis]
MKKTSNLCTMPRHLNPVIALLFFGFVAGCANINQVSTNLDKENFQHYFSPTNVRILTQEQELGSDYRFLGLVEGQSCQAKAHHAVPNEIDARTQARRQAFGLGANAIIFSQCVLIEDDQAAKHCLATLVCYGRAYHIEQE